MLPSRSAPVPFYEKVKQTISDNIASGVWRPHDRIPSEAELVAQFGFSLNDNQPGVAGING